MTTPNTVSLQVIHDGPRNAIIKAFLQSAGTQAAVAATATLTFTGAPVAAETFVLNGVTFTARASGASGDEFDIGGTVTLTADAVVAAVNGSASVGVAAITASNVAGVVTFTADVAGAAGNSLTLTEALTNATRTIFAGGADAVGELTDQIVVDVSALSGSPGKVHLAKVQSRLRGFDVLLEFEATTDKPILTLTPELVDPLEFDGFGGIPNNGGTGVTGDISITTVGFATAGTDVGWIVLEVTKD